MPFKKKAPAVPPEKSRSDVDLGKELGSMYSEQGLTPLDMSKLDQARHSTARKILVGLIVFFGVLAAVSWAGFFFFSPSNEKFSGEGVALDVQIPAQVKSGELTTVLVRWKNEERLALGTASLELRLPKEFVVQKMQPQADSEPRSGAGANEWRIGSIATGKEGSVTVQGIFLAPLGKELDIQAILTYRPADFNSEFQKVSTVGVLVADSIFDLSVAGPVKVLPGDKVTLTFAYKNASDNKFQQLKLRALYPSTFIPETTAPEALTESKNEWILASVEPGGEGKITVTGTFASDAKGKIEVKAQIGIIGQDDAFQLQKEAGFTTDVLEGDLVTLLILNGKPDSQAIAFGETLRYAITYRNTGNVALGDISFTLKFEAEPDAKKMLLWNKLKDVEEGVRDGDNITWNKKQVSALGKIGPGEEGTINIELPVMENPLENTVGVDYRITSWVEATVDLIDGEKVSRTTKTQPIIARLMSDTKLTSEARYFNDDGIPVGTGPLPPVVGQGTTYRISWTVDNTLHELADLKISAKLPPNVAWTGKSTVDAGDLRFDAAAEKMVWTLNWMPTSIKKLTVSFDVTLIPSVEQTGKIASLIDATILETTDKVIGSSILLSTPPLTTALENDDSAIGKARVLAQ